MKKQNSKVVALLPIKLNSERVPGKNFKTLGSKPLYKWILDKLISIDIIDKIIINTDAIEKFNNINSSKIVIRKRINEICGNDVSMNLVIKDDLMNTEGEIFFMTHATNPFLKKKTIIDSIKEFKKKNLTNFAVSIFSVTKFQSRFYNKDCEPINHDPSKLIKTQDLEIWYEENSSFYIFTKKSFKLNNSRIGMKPFPYITDKLESLDIDTINDWKLAETIVKSNIRI